jgi:16S rRNA (uracil1498-N3)-methyltransferase
LVVSVSDRFYTPEPLEIGEFILDGPEAHHLAHVRRFASGDTVTLFNGDGREYVAVIAEVAKKEVHLRCMSRRRCPKAIGETF